MELVIRLILSLASIDFVLTLFWVYRWQSSKFLRKFKLRVPIRLIEANPIINHTIKSFGVYPGLVLGYAIVLMIQILLAGVRNVETWRWLEICAIGLSWFIVAVLLGAVIGHVRNNITTNNGHIIKMTRAYNKKMKS